MLPVFFCSSRNRRHQSMERTVPCTFCLQAGTFCGKVSYRQEAGQLYLLPGRQNAPWVQKPKGQMELVCFWLWDRRGLLLLFRHLLGFFLHRFFQVDRKLLIALKGEDKAAPALGDRA